MIAQRFRELDVKKNKDGSKVQVTEKDRDDDDNDDDVSYFHFEDDVMKKVQSSPSAHSL